jgi:DNA (cytosine-5)-methyltransferase 1
MKLGSLFSGGGLGDLGFLAAGLDIAWQCEIDEYCQSILELRYPESKKYRDIKSLKGDELEPVDIITGGFPCQPFSVAGKQKGKEDNRYLWPEMLRVIKECKPRWIVGENVPGIINLALDTVCADLETEGYEVWPIVFPSHALGAWHKRDRLWIVGYSQHNGSFETKDRGSVHESQEQIKQDKSIQFKGTSSLPTYVANPIIGPQGTAQREITNTGWPDNIQDYGNLMGSNLRDGSEALRRFWESEPAVGRVAHGMPNRVDRLKMLGNGQVPACTYVIGSMINAIEGANSNDHIPR